MGCANETREREASQIRRSGVVVVVTRCSRASPLCIGGSLSSRLSGGGDRCASCDLGCGKTRRLPSHGLTADVKRRIPAVDPLLASTGDEGLLLVVWFLSFLFFFCLFLFSLFRAASFEKSVKKKTSLCRWIA